jgi:hypothetical protein
MAARAVNQGQQTIDQRIHSQSFASNVRQLVEILGSGLVAVVGDVKETRAVREWIEEKREPSDRRRQIVKFAFYVALLISNRHGREGAQSWFQGLNAHLGDKVPALMLRDLREKTIDEVAQTERHILAAARNFVER